MTAIDGGSNRKATSIIKTSADGRDKQTTVGKFVVFFKFVIIVAAFKHPMVP